MSETAERVTSQDQQHTAGDVTRTCQCDCARWAHAGWNVCQVNPPVIRLVLMYFLNDLNPFGPYPRRCCGPCAEHIKEARARGGVALAPEPVDQAALESGF
jgi:hypothetical protein